MDIYRYDSRYNFVESLFPVIFITVFAIILIAFAIAMATGVARWMKNNRSPVLTVDAKIVNMRGEPRPVHGGAHTTRVIYRASFEVESGDRIDLEIDSQQYGQLSLGDVGRLTFQGTRFKSFVRQGKRIR